MAAWASFWAFWASAALSLAAATLEFSSLCLAVIWAFWLSSSLFLLCSSARWLFNWVFCSSSWALSFSSASLALRILVRISVSFTEMSCRAWLKVSSSYRFVTEESMATLPPSRSSCMAAMWPLKAVHWVSISPCLAVISPCLAVISCSLAAISCSLTPMLFCTTAIWLLSTPIWLWTTVTFSFSSDSRALAACSFFFASDSSFLCCSMDWLSLFSLFWRLDMLVAAVAG